MTPEMTKQVSERSTIKGYYLCLIYKQNLTDKLITMYARVFNGMINYQTLVICQIVSKPTYIKLHQALV